MISLVLAVLHSTAFFKTARAAPPPTSAPVDVSGVLDLSHTPEEALVSEGLPPTPESGSENPQDLLQSAPAIAPARRSSKSASAKGASDGLPDALPLVPGAPSDLPPAPSADQLAPEASTEIPSDPIPAEEPVAETPTEEAPPAEPLEDVTIPAEPEAVAEAAPESGTSTRRFDRSIPLYDREKPTWGVDIHGSLEAFGTPIVAQEEDASGNPVGDPVETNVRGFGIGFEYQPEFLQSIGVVSLGPSLNLYVCEPQGDLTKNAFSIYSLGFSAKYQLNFMRGQWVVPFVGFEAQMIHYSFQDSYSGSGWTTASSPTFGALILLNWMEPSSAHTLFAETGIRRSYLLAEVKNLQSGEPALSSDGPAIYFGMRLEY